MGKRPKYGYIVSPPGAQAFGFIPDPDKRARWMRVEPCVLIVPCPVCKVKRGKPCCFSAGSSVGVHWARREDAKGWRVSTKITPAFIVAIEDQVVLDDPKDEETV